MLTTAAATTVIRAVECPASALGPSAWSLTTMTISTTTDMATGMTITSPGIGATAVTLKIGHDESLEFSVVRG